MTDLELMYLLEEEGYEPDLENLLILKEGLENGEIEILDEAKKFVKQASEAWKRGDDETAIKIEDSHKYGELESDIHDLGRRAATAKAKGDTRQFERLKSKGIQVAGEHIPTRNRNLPGFEYKNSKYPHIKRNPDTSKIGHNKK